MQASYANGDALAVAKAREEAAATAGPLRLATTTATATAGGQNSALHPLWLETSAASERQRAFICADASWFRFSPGADALIFVSHGAAWVRPLLRVKAAEYEAMVREDERRRAVADAETLATAFLRMVQDAEYFPKPDAVQRALGGYLLNTPDLIGRLVYTYPGGAGLTLNDPGNTQLGYVTGPGGRAIIFADGHANWQDD